MVLLPSKLNVASFPHEADSSDLIGATMAGKLKLKEGLGGFSREKGYGLFMPTIYTTFKQQEVNPLFRYIIVERIKRNHNMQVLNLHIPSLRQAKQGRSCYNSFGLKGAPSENLVRMMMKSLMRHSPTISTHQLKSSSTPKLEAVSKKNGGKTDHILFSQYYIYINMHKFRRLARLVSHLAR